MLAWRVGVVVVFDVPAEGAIRGCHDLCVHQGQRGQGERGDYLEVRADRLGEWSERVLDRTWVRAKGVCRFPRRAAPQSRLAHSRGAGRSKAGHRRARTQLSSWTRQDVLSSIENRRDYRIHKASNTHHRCCNNVISVRLAIPIHTATTQSTNVGYGYGKNAIAVWLAATTSTANARGRRRRR